MAGGGVADVKLLSFWASPPALRVRLALSIKGVNHEYVEEDLRNKSELLLQSNPVHKKVPVLIHGGKPVCESSIILQYIDEILAGVGPSLLPEDPHDRAMARFWASYINEKVLLYTLCSRMTTLPILTFIKNSDIYKVKLV
jgi:glutathione S-transferase